MFLSFVTAAKAGGPLALSAATSGERAKAGPNCPAEGEGRELVRTPRLWLSKLAVVTTAQIAAPLPNPLPLRAKSAKGRGTDRDRWGAGTSFGMTPEFGFGGTALTSEVL